MKTLLIDIYKRLLKHHGKQHWWPGESHIEIIIGAILTQGVRWETVYKTIISLKENNLLTLQSLRDIDESRLAELIKSSVYFNQKTRKIKGFVHYIFTNYEGDINKLFAQDTKEIRNELLSIYGIGQETADDIVLYAANKPVFIIDKYTKRILNRIGITIESNRYQDYQKLFMDNLDENVSIFNEYHALLDEHGSRICTKSNPACEKCCLNDICSFGTKQIST